MLVTSSTIVLKAQQNRSFNGRFSPANHWPVLPAN
jgi:hypothetical protein